MLLIEYEFAMYTSFHCNSMNSINLDWQLNGFVNDVNCVWPQFNCLLNCYCVSSIFKKELYLYHPFKIVYVYTMLFCFPIQLFRMWWANLHKIFVWQSVVCCTKFPFILNYWEIHSGKFSDIIISPIKQLNWLILKLIF